MKKKYYSNSSSCPQSYPPSGISLNFTGPGVHIQNGIAYEIWMNSNKKNTCSDDTKKKRIIK